MVQKTRHDELRNDWGLYSVGAGLQVEGNVTSGAATSVKQDD